MNNSNKHSILIYGAGGFARELAWLIDSSDTYPQPECFISDAALDGETLMGKPVYTLANACELFPKASIVIAIADTATRLRIAHKVSATDLSFGQFVHDSVLSHHSNSIGDGTIICAGNFLMPDVNVGLHVQICLACTIGHDVTIGDFTTISPGVHISGNVHIGENVFIGAGTTIIQGTAEQPLIIADDTVIAAGACVTSSTLPNSMYAGVPAVRKR